MPDRWLILADDLTGATDAGAAFARRGLRTEVLWGNSTSSGGSVIAYDVASRGLSAIDAAARNGAAARRLLSPDRMLFKKIDSTLRGQPAREIASLHATLRALSRPTRGIFAPANPAMRRTTREGRVYLDGKPLEFSEVWQREHSYPDANLVAILADAGIAARHVPLPVVRGDPAALRARLTVDADVMVCDAETDADLDGIVAAGFDAAGFFIGTAGLAAALAKRYPAANPERRAALRPGGGMLVVVGSMAAASRAAADQHATNLQVRRMSWSREVLLSPARAMECTQAGAQVAAWLARGEDVLVEISQEAGAGPGPDPRVSRRLAECLGPAMHEVSGLIVTGGETATVLLEQWYVDGITLADEIEPGIALGEIRVHDRRIPVITKPGAFGDAGCLVRSLEQLRKERGSQR